MSSEESLPSAELSREGATGTITSQRRWLVVVVVSAAVVAAGAGWIAGTRIKSPAQVAAETAAPDPSLIAVPVERATISSEVIVRGTVRHGTPQPIALPTSPLKPDSQAVTSIPERGASIEEGSVALGLSGRPVMAFQGAQPAYRDLSVGTSGADVMQLEAALNRLQFAPGPVDGVFDNATAGAMASLYQQAGWTPFGITDAQQADLRAAHEAAAAAEERRLQAKLAVETAGAAPTDLNQAETDLANAHDAVAMAAGEVSAATARQKAAHDAVPIVQAADDAAVATQQYNDALAAADVLTKTNALDAAIQNEQTAMLLLAEGQAIDPVTGEPTATPAQLAELQAAVDQATAAVATARVDLAAAQAGLSSTSVSGAASVQASGAAVIQAVNDAALADADLMRAVAAQGTSDANLLRAQAARDRVSRPLGTGTLNEALSAASREATRTSNEVALLLETTGFQVPADEVLFLPAMPVRVDDVKVKPGELFTSEAISVSSFTLAVDSALSLTDATLVKVGAVVTIEESDLGITVQGAVTEVADRPGTKGTDPQHVYLEVAPEEAPDQLVGASVKLTIAVESTRGDVLAVPVSALSVAAGGDTRVEVLDGEGTRFVTVKPGLAANGLVEITPVEGSLDVEDQVIVGNRTGASSATTTGDRRAG